MDYNLRKAHIEESVYEEVQRNMCDAKRNVKLLFTPQIT